MFLPPHPFKAWLPLAALATLPGFAADPVIAINQAIRVEYKQAPATKAPGQIDPMAADMAFLVASFERFRAASAEREAFCQIGVNAQEEDVLKAARRWQGKLERAGAIHPDVHLPDLALTLRTLQYLEAHSDFQISNPTAQLFLRAGRVQVERLQRGEGVYGKIDPDQRGAATLYLLVQVYGRSGPFSRGPEARALFQDLLAATQKVTRKLPEEKRNHVYTALLHTVADSREPDLFRILLRTGLPPRVMVDRKDWVALLTMHAKVLNRKDLEAWLGVTSASSAGAASGAAGLRMEKDLLLSLERKLAPAGDLPILKARLAEIEGGGQALPAQAVAQAVATPPPAAAAPGADNRQAFAEERPADAWAARAFRLKTAARTLTHVPEPGEPFHRALYQAISSAGGAERIQQLGVTGRLEPEDLETLVGQLPDLRELDLSHTWHVHQGPVACPGGLEALGGLVQLERLILRDVQVGSRNLPRLEQAVRECERLAWVVVEPGFVSKRSEPRLAELSATLEARGGRLERDGNPGAGPRP